MGRSKAPTLPLHLQPLTTKQPEGVRLNSDPESNESGSQGPRIPVGLKVSGHLGPCPCALFCFCIATLPNKFVVCVYFKPSVPTPRPVPTWTILAPSKAEGLQGAHQSKSQLSREILQPRTPPVASKSQREAAHTSHPPLLPRGVEAGGGVLLRSPQPFN